QEALLNDGEIVLVKVEGWKDVHYALAPDIPLLQELAAGRTPAAWTPLETDTTQEALFLAALDPGRARGRAQTLLGIDYVWGRYTPQDKRHCGYSPLRLPWRDQLVARFDRKYDRPSDPHTNLGLWLGNEKSGRHPNFAAALARASIRFT